jgi:hypothetical protein
MCGGGQLDDGGLEPRRAARGDAERNATSHCRLVHHPNRFHNSCRERERLWLWGVKLTSREQVCGDDRW